MRTPVFLPFLPPLILGGLLLPASALTAPKTAAKPVAAAPAVVAAPVRPPADWSDYGCQTQKAGLMGSLKNAGSATMKQIKKVAGKYTVNGANGKYVCQVSARKIDPGALKDPTTRNTFSATSRGEYQDRQLDLPLVTAQLQTIVDAIAAQWPGVKPEQVKVRIVGTNVYQAEALPDNSIKVHLGLLVQAKSESEIAFILAHEYAHIALGHLNRNDSLQAQNALISALSDGYYYGTKLSQARWNEISNQFVIKDQAAITDARLEAADRSQQLRLVLDVLVTPVWKRSQEDEADTLGYDLATRAGYNVAGTVGVAFQTMAQSEGQQKSLSEKIKTDLETSLATATETQAKAAAALIAEGKLNETALKSETDKTWASFNHDARQRVTTSLKGVLTRTHRLPEERAVGLDAYATAAYGDGDAVSAVTPWLGTLRKSAEYSDGAAVVAAVDAASAARAENNLAEAKKYIAKAEATSFRNTPMVLNERARILKREKKYAEADAKFRAAHLLPGQSVEAFQDHVDLLLIMRRWADAETQANAAVARFGDKKPFLPAYVSVRFATGKQDEAVRTLVDCVSTENPELKQACINSAPHPDDAAFKRLTPANQESIILARGKVNDQKSVDRAHNMLTTFLTRADTANKDTTPD
ncbi:M48 family metalloprotease [Asticcacaulis sp. 201]|uniref:M48 family metalloprotease n=1 Tax=Asticcacaulis sp. 201 TaxID=3028787 RepID=UPI0029169B75|nr:M48 family metalloprotease [Asticcacaulis sp. 201]MDV6329984.1 M48 family metalloprotease [Asticcacaulis sp. 201]